MEFLNTIFIFDMTIVTRIAFSIFFGFLLGFEREITGKFAGLRTHILVSVGATVFTLLSLYGFKYITAEGTVGVNDPARIAAQIITGIGFIGAGTVMRQGSNISGITTAATLWVSAAVGMACGCGMFFLAGVSAILTLLILILIRHFERKFLLGRISTRKHFEISFVCPFEYLDSVYKIMQNNFPSVTKFKKKVKDNKEMSIKVDIVTYKPISKVSELLSDDKNLSSLEITEIHD